MSKTTLFEIAEIIEKRKGEKADKSYVAKLFGRGRLKIAQKVGEEATELAIAAVAEGKEQIVSESADLLFHLLVLLSDAKIPLEDVMEALESRKGVSGLEEKARRKK